MFNFKSKVAKEFVFKNGLIQKAKVTLKDYLTESEMKGKSMLTSDILDCFSVEVYER